VRYINPRFTYFTLLTLLTCAACDCDPIGSEHGGECESRTDVIHDLVAGRCICKRLVVGRRCDSCMDGYWNMKADNPDGCEGLLLHWISLDPEGGSQKATLAVLVVLVVVISSLKALLICSGALRNLAYTFVLTLIAHRSTVSDFSLIS